MHKCGMERIWKVGQEPGLASNVAMLHAELEVQWHKFEHDDSASAPGPLPSGLSVAAQDRVSATLTSADSFNRAPTLSLKLKEIQMFRLNLTASVWPQHISVRARTRAGWLSISECIQV